MKQKIKTGILMTALAVGSLHIVNRCGVENCLEITAWKISPSMMINIKVLFMTGVSVRSIIQKQEAVLLSCLFTIWLRLPLPTNGICC